MVAFFFQTRFETLLQGNLCLPGHARKAILEPAHDSKLAGHFAFSKTLALLGKSHWRHMTKHTLQYFDGCFVRQKHKHFYGQLLIDPAALPIPTRRWGLVGTDFVVKLTRKL